MRTKLETEQTNEQSWEGMIKETHVFLCQWRTFKWKLIFTEFEEKPIFYLLKQKLTIYMFYAYIDRYNIFTISSFTHSSPWVLCWLPVFLSNSWLNK